MKTNHQFAHGDNGASGFCDLVEFQSEDRYRAIVEAQTELICRFLPDRTLSFVNLAFCHYFGKQRHELIGENFLFLIPEAEQEAVQQHWRSLNLDNPIGTYEHPVIAPHGEIRSHHWTNRAIFDRQGRLVEFQSVGRERTECQQAEEALHRREQEFRALVENSPDIITRFDQDYRHLYVNPAVEQATGIPSQTFIGKTHQDLGMQSEIVTFWQEIVQSTFATGQERIIEFNIPTPNGIK